MSEPLLSVKNMKKTFQANGGMFSKKKFVHAVNDVSFDIYPGETFSLVGESGCGKSTTGKLIDHLITPDSGEIWFEGKEISRLSEKEMRPLRSDIQMVFQDPYGSLNPRMKVQDLIGEPLLIHTNMSAGERLKKVHELLGTVGLSPSHGERYPHEFSGGQRQRIGIARALVMEPQLLLCDEPISALDVSIRAQIINLLNELKVKRNLSIMFIAHDLSVVKYFCDTIAVMYFGDMVELASSDELFKHPLHPYTKSLLSAIPRPDPLLERHRNRIKYDPKTMHDYSKEKPTFQEIVPGHWVLANSEEIAKYKEEMKHDDIVNAEKEAYEAKIEEKMKAQLKQGKTLEEAAANVAEVEIDSTEKEAVSQSIKPSKAALFKKLFK